MSGPNHGPDDAKPQRPCQMENMDGLPIPQIWEEAERFEHEPPTALPRPWTVSDWLRLVIGVALLGFLLGLVVGALQ